MILWKRRGLGDNSQCLDYSVWTQELGFENCDPHDGACISRNQQRSIAEQQIQEDTGGCVTASTPISFTPDNSTAAQNAFMNNAPLNESYATIGGTPAVNATFGTPQQPTPILTPQGQPNTPAPTVTVSSAPPPAQSNVTVSSAPPPAGSTNSSNPAAPGFDLSSIPWWGWVIAAGGVLMLARK